MIQGVVNAAYEPIVTLAIQGPSGQSREIEAVVDTGYNGYLTLPPAVALALGLPFVTTNPAFLADGSEVTFDVYSVTVLWDGRLRDVDAHMSDATPRWDGRLRDVDAHMSDATPLVGMRLLHDHDLSIQVRAGGRVVIQAGE